MPTEIKERLFIKDTENKTKLIVFHNGLDIILGNYILIYQ
jgi:hypothetical protein